MRFPPPSGKRKPQLIGQEYGFRFPISFAEQNTRLHKYGLPRDSEGSELTGENFTHRIDGKILIDIVDCSSINMEGKRVKVKHPLKNEITDGVIVSIKSQEPRSPCVDYILEDGAMLRVCTDITAIIKVLDEKGQPLKDANGANVYNINYNVKFTAFNTGK